MQARKSGETHIRLCSIDAYNAGVSLFLWGESKRALKSSLLFTFWLPLVGRNPMPSLNTSTLVFLVSESNPTIRGDILETLPCNALQVTHSKESFSLVFTYEAPDRRTKSVYVSISPSGAKTLMDLVAAEVSAFEKEQHVVVKAWETKADNSEQRSKVYLS